MIISAIICGLVLQGCMSLMLPTDSGKKSWREYYFCSRFGKFFGMLNFSDLHELEQSTYYVPQRYQYARYLVEYGKKYVDSECCCDNERVKFLSQGFVIPSCYLKYKFEKLSSLREDLIVHFIQLTNEHPRRIDAPMIKGKHSKLILGPDRNLALPNLQEVEYEIEMECRLENKEDDFAKHLEIVSSVQRSKPVLHTLEIRSASCKRGSFFRNDKPAVIETGTLIKAASTPAYLNLQRLRISGGVIEPYIASLLPLISNQPLLHSLEILYDISEERLALSTKSLQSICDFLNDHTFSTWDSQDSNCQQNSFVQLLRNFFLFWQIRRQHCISVKQKLQVLPCKDF